LGVQEVNYPHHILPHAAITATLDISIDAGPSKSDAIYASTAPPHNREMPTWLGVQEINTYHIPPQAAITATLDISIIPKEMRVHPNQMLNTLAQHLPITGRR
jgi:hypothetical protein